ncbi:hypothetical protein GEV33_006419 [Tenebrio molitor]|uniref:Uncharacterized protein n=1 Tax=Tenebrio molitor TaxID=7067 RepID=A0A8J6HL87_TENMO|nr:hypothetical protein GEV33_006419 [Tenebrio molitor]
MNQKSADLRPLIPKHPYRTLRYVITQHIVRHGARRPQVHLSVTVAATKDSPPDGALRDSRNLVVKLLTLRYVRQKC